jgi:hypothetical protein
VTMQGGVDGQHLDRAASLRVLKVSAPPEYSPPRAG